MKLNSRWFTTAALSLSTLVLAQCSGGGYAGKTARFSAETRPFQVQTQRNWRPTISNDIPVAMNPSVQKWVMLFQTRFKSHFDRWVGRLGQYGPTVEQILLEEQVPKDLIYLAMIESGFNLSATSVASAVGPWQFISSTGRMYGLHNDAFMDDRRDLIKATRAAARHLKDLHKSYGDWYLAFAAYNAGPGSVNRAIRGTGSKDYWTLTRSRFLRQETKDYVPKILAALHIVKNYSKFGYNDESFKSPLQYDRVTVPDATDLTVIAQCAESSLETLKELNPALTSGMTRPGHAVEVFIPKGTQTAFLRNYARVPADARVSGLSHAVARGETVRSIARRYGVQPHRLMAMNQLNPRLPLRAGQVLKVPGDRQTIMAMANRMAPSTQQSGTWVNHRVQRGDTLGRIAGRYRTSVGNLSRWNRLNVRRPLRVGQVVKVYQPGRRTSWGNTFYAAPVQPRMSGVAHIIAKESLNPVVVKPMQPVAPQQTPSEAAAKKVAVASKLSQSALSADAPGVVKQVGEVSPDASQLALAAAQNNVIPTSIVQPAYTPRPAVASNLYHTVRRGDTLGRIAMRYRIPLNQLRAINGLRNDMVRPNQRLLIRKGNGSQQFIAKARSQYNPTRSSFVTHQTRPGDTLWKISKRYGVKINDIKRWNRLSGDSLRPNQRLQIMNGSR